MEIAVRTPKGTSHVRTGSGIPADQVIMQVVKMQELHEEPYKGAQWLLFTEFGEVPIPGDVNVRHGYHLMKRVGHEQEDHEAIQEGQDHTDE